MSEPPHDPQQPQDPSPGQPYPSYGDYQAQYPGHPGAPSGGSPYGAMPPSFDAGAALGRSFRYFGRAPGPYLLVTLLVFVVAIVLGIASYAVSDGDSSAYGGGGGAGAIVLRILSNIVTTLLCAALVRGALDSVDGTEVTFGGMFSRWDKLQVLVASLLAGLATAIGFILLVIPGLVLLFLLWYTNYFVIDENCSAVEAMGRSVRFAAAHVGPLLLTALLAVVVLLGGAIACGVGLLVALPVAFLLAAQAFRALQGRPLVEPTAAA
jgi:uncharacterized membrane protein